MPYSNLLLPESLHICNGGSDLMFCPMRVMTDCHATQVSKYPPDHQDHPRTFTGSDKEQTARCWVELQPQNHTSKAGQLQVP